MKPVAYIVRTAAQRPFRRAGRLFGPEPQLVEAATLTADQVAELFRTRDAGVLLVEEVAAPTPPPPPGGDDEGDEPPEGGDEGDAEFAPSPETDAATPRAKRRRR